MRQLSIASGLAAVFLFAAALAAETPGKVDFRRDIQPLFQQHCVGCHGPSQQMGGMRLDRRSSAKGVHGGTIIGPGNADGSILYLRLSGTKYGTQMPPTGALSPDLINLVKAWIDQGAEWPDDVSGERPPTPPDPRAMRMMEALRNGDRPAFTRLVREDPGAAKLAGAGGSTPLMYAALYGDVAAVRQLIEAGADPKAANDVGATALMWAADDAEKTRLLLEHGADPKAISTEGRTALRIAVANQHAPGVVRMLLDHGASSDPKSPGNRGLFNNAGQDEATLRTLLDHGISIERLSSSLQSALESDCAACVDMLIPSVPKADLSDSLIQAPGQRDPRIFKILLEHGADAKSVEPGLAFTALMYAADSEIDAVDKARKLIERGADVNAKTADGSTALDFALRSGNESAAEALRKAGAKQGDGPAAPVLKPKPAASARAAVERSIPLLQRSDVAFIKKTGCVSCHNNNLTALTIAAARKQGVQIDDGVAREQLHTIAAYIESNRERYLQGIPIAGGPDTAGYLLLGLAAEGWRPDPATDAMARYLKDCQRANGSWPTFGGRPPIESSDIQNTATIMRALQTYTLKSQPAEYKKTVQLAAEWLAKAEPLTTEDRAFQVLGLLWAGGKQEIARQAARKLLQEQRGDGGWSQTALLKSDAYATGQALFALKEAGTLAPTDAAYTRGAQFLMNTQLEDGSWFVRSRTIPFQPYFDSGFPYGIDQFISIAATNWATLALLPLAR